MIGVSRGGWCGCGRFQRFRHGICIMVLFTRALVFLFLASSM